MPGNAIALSASGTPSAGSASRDSYVHASLEVYEMQPASGQGGARKGSQITTIQCQFNPKELSITKSAQWEKKPARHHQAPPPEFKSPEPAKMTLELFFDATQESDPSVLDAVEKLFACCVPTQQSMQGGSHGSPPLVMLHWGNTRSFFGYVTSVNAKYTRFTSGGMPIRATASVSIEEMPGVPRGQNPTSGALSATRTHTVVDGDTLASVAMREYGSPAAWRAVAEANGIDDPLRLPAGRTLLLPSPDELSS